MITFEYLLLLIMVFVITDYYVLMSTYLSTMGLSMRSPWVWCCLITLYSFSLTFITFGMTCKLFYYKSHLALPILTQVSRTNLVNKGWSIKTRAIWQPWSE